MQAVELGLYNDLDWQAQARKTFEIFFDATCHYPRSEVGVGVLIPINNSSNHPSWLGMNLSEAIEQLSQFSEPQWEDDAVFFPWP
jgi:hypothetical protein